MTTRENDSGRLHESADEQRYRLISIDAVFDSRL